MMARLAPVTAASHWNPIAPKNPTNCTIKIASVNDDTGIFNSSLPNCEASASTAWIASLYKR